MISMTKKMMEMNGNFSLIIPAAGSSTRMGGVKKQFAPFNKAGSTATVLSETLVRFLETKRFSVIVVCLANADVEYARQLVLRDARVSSLAGSFTAIYYIAGGNTRQASVHAGLEFLALQHCPPHIVLVHDAARPHVSADVILRVLEKAEAFSAVVPVIPTVDTQKQVDENNLIRTHLKRSELVSVQTPQGFIFKNLLNAHRQAAHDARTYTDDSELYARYIDVVGTCAGEKANRKITYTSDLPSSIALPMFRTGIGYDLHRLVAGRALMLGGVRIPSEKGCEAHSDGDALLHALTDALLGAAGLGDIGELFPPADTQWKDADSAQFLKEAANRLYAVPWQVENIDCVITLQRPKLLHFRPQMRARIAAILSIDMERVFIKAKTGESIGIIGTEQAVAVCATCLISRQAPI